MNSFYNYKELEDLGIKFGKNVFISKKASIYNAQDIVVGDNVRIDDFCILSGIIKIGSFVHISAYCALYASEGIYFADYTGASPRTTIFSVTDDFSGKAMIGPMVDQSLINPQKGCVVLEKFSQVGAGSVVMPGVRLNEGAVLGAMSFVKKDLEEWTIYAGIPAKKIKKREKIFV